MRSSILLTDLSTDVLRIIFSFVAECGNDIEYLARTTRLLRSVSVPFIQKHRYGCVSDKNPGTVARILRDVILDPPVAQHVKRMEITNHLCLSDFFNPSLDELLLSNKVVYRKAVERFIPLHSQDPWIHEIINGNDDPLKALLILLSPKMTSLDWEVHNTFGWTTRGSENEKIHYFLDYLRKTKSTPHLRPPINLEHLSIHMHKAYSATEVLDISQLLPLLTLPKLKHLILSDVQGPFRSPTTYSYLDGDEEISRTSPLKILEIKYSCLSAEGLNAILSGIIALEEFECRISDNNEGYISGHANSLGQLLKAIETNTSHSLKSLNLIGNDTHGIIGGGYVLDDIPSFRNFISLTHLKLNPEIFTNSFVFSPLPQTNHIETDNFSFLFGVPYNQPSIPSSSLVIQHEIQPEIASLMPPNLEILELEGMVRNGDSAARLVDKLHELLIGKELFLPSLRKIVVRDVGGEHGCWVEEEKVGLRMACENRGVEADLRSSWEF